MTGRILSTLAAAFLLITPVSMTSTAAQGGPPPLSPPPSGSPPPVSLSVAEPSGMAWFAAIDGQPQGPFTEAQIRERGLAPETLVWREGMPAWTALQEVPELRGPPTDVVVRPPPLPPEPRDETVYFVAENGASSAALSRDDVARRIAAGSVDGSTLVWHDGMAAWEPLDETRLASLLDEPVCCALPPNAADAIVGNWQGRVTLPVDGLGPVDIAITAVFGGDGTFSYSGSGMMDLSSRGVDQPVRLEVAVEGTWRAEAQGANRVRADLSGTMRMAAPDLDLTETEPLNEVITFDIIDRDTVRDDEGNVLTRTPG